MALAIGHHLKKSPPEIKALSPEEFAECVMFYMNPARQKVMEFAMPPLPRAARNAMADDAALERQARAWAARRGKIVKKPGKKGAAGPGG